MNSTVFMDRDGTIVRDVHYCGNPDDIELLPFVGEGIALLNKSGFKVIVITNQSGIARGCFTEEILERIHHRMRGDLARYGASIDAIYYCPHHPDDGCPCRKPNAGLLYRAIDDWDIDPNRSYFIGDKYIDAGAANKVGCKSILIPCGEPETELLESKREPRIHIDFVCRNFSDAVNWLLVDRERPPKISVVIPTINEEKSLPYVLPKIPEEYEVILVDGYSTDRTTTIARELRPDIRILYQPGKGKGDAMRHGFNNARGEIVFTMDADGSFNSEEMGSFIKPLLDGYHLVKGSRFLGGGGTDDMTPLRKAGNKFFTTLANILHGVRYTDLVYGYHAFRRCILNKLELRSDGFEIDTEMYIKVKKKGFKAMEVPSFENNRLSGSGKLQSFSDGRRILGTILRECLYG